MDVENVINVINSGNVKSFKKLIAGIDPQNILEEFIMHFIECENLKCLKFFIGVYPELINMQNEEGETLLHFAVKNSYKATAFLLENDADITIKTLYGRTPLLEFFENYYFEDHYNILELLLEQGANIDDVDEYGNGPLHYLAVNIKPSSDDDDNSPSINISEIYENMFNLLVKHNSKPFLKNNKGDTPLFYLIKSEGYEGCNYELSKIVEGWLIKLF